MINEGRIIALLAFRNEAIFLPIFMTRIRGIVDEVLGYDDSSSDSSRKIFESYGGRIIENIPSKKTGIGATKEIRTLLLEEGRRRGGTHFVVLDADEIFVGSDNEKIRKRILQLKQAEKLICDWVMLGSSIGSFLNEKSVWQKRGKDFAFADSITLKYPNDPFVHFARTPINPEVENDFSKSEPNFAVLHLQFVNWELGQIKQCWYRLQETIRLRRNYTKVNQRYSFTKEVQSPEVLQFFPIQIKQELDSLNFSEILTFPVSKSWYYNDIQDLIHSLPNWRIRNLDIWFLPIMRTLYINRFGKEHYFSRQLDFFNSQYLRMIHIAFQTRMMFKRMKKGSQAFTCKTSN